MKIIYLGPSPSVPVFPYPDHVQGETVDYPAHFGADLIASSNRQQFVIDEDAEKTAAEQDADRVPDPGGDEIPDEAVIATGPAPDDMTVKQLKALLGKLDIAIPARARRDDLIALVNAHTAEPPAEE